MSTHRDWPSLVIRPGYSRWLSAFIAFTHGLAGMAVWPLPIGGYKALLLLAVLASFGYGLYAQALRLAPWSIRTAIWQPDGAWRLVLRSGHEVVARLSPSTFVSVPLIVLNLQHRWRRYALVLTRDSVDPAQLRHLRQRLRARGGRISSVDDGTIA